MLGLSTYAYLWRRHPETPHPFSLVDILDDAVRLDVDVVQVCDVPELEHADPAWLQALRRQADERGLVLETGTRGVEPEHLLAHLDKARRLGARFVRSMLSSPRSTPGISAAVEALRTVAPRFAAAGITLGLETYEQYATQDLVKVITEVGSDYVGICLDPGNSVARLEHPMRVVELAAPYVVNLHVKDFAFTRKEGTVGFTYAGAPLGEGLLDYDGMVAVLRAAGRSVNQVVEHWVTRQGTMAQTCALEEEWVDGAVRWLKA